MKKRLLITGALVLSLAAGMTGCSSSSQPANNSSNNNNAAAVTTNTNTNANTAKEDDAVSLTLGQTSTNDNLELTLNSVEWMDQLRTPGQSNFGTYSYYEPKEGCTLLVISGTYKNLGAEGYSPSSAAKAEIKINDKYTVETSVAWALPDDHNWSNGRVDPLSTANIYIYANVTDEMKSALQSGTMTINFKSYTKTGDISYRIGSDSIGKFKLEFKA